MTKCYLDHEHFNQPNRRLMRVKISHLTQEDKTKIMDLIHNKDKQQKLLENPTDPDVKLLDYVFDLTLQQQFLTENL